MSNIQSSFEHLSPILLVEKVEQTSFNKTQQSMKAGLVNAIIAGVFIGLAFVFYISVTAGGGSLPYGLSKLIGGFCFSVGLLLVIVLGGNLFTSSVLNITARASKKISTRQMFKHWVLVYAGNFIGALMLIGLMIGAKHYDSGHGLLGLGYLQTAMAKLSHAPLQAFFLGIMCNILVCLAIFMAHAGKSLTDKLVAVFFPVALFVAAGFEHCIANMFLIPMAIITKDSASADFWVNSGLNPMQFADLTWSQFFFTNLIPVTVGNIVGGAIFVGLTFWFVYRQPALKTENCG